MNFSLKIKANEFIKNYIYNKNSFRNNGFLIDFYMPYVSKMERSDIISIAKSTLEIEISELEKLRDRLNDDFARAVEIIHSAKGKLIVVGIGKSAHVGNKIVATLNSTGTPAVYLHAAEAIHGDLGMILSHDVVMIISKSGELRQLLKIGWPIITNFTVEQFCQLWIAGFQPATWRYTIRHISELIRP